MTFQDIKRHFRTVDKAREALGLVSRQTIYNWQRTGVPEGQQYRIQVLTRGRLRADQKTA